MLSNLGLRPEIWAVVRCFEVCDEAEHVRSTYFENCRESGILLYDSPKSLGVIVHCESVTGYLILTPVESPLISLITIDKIDSSAYYAKRRDVACINAAVTFLQGYFKHQEDAQ